MQVTYHGCYCKYLGRITSICCAGHQTIRLACTMLCVIASAIKRDESHCASLPLPSRFGQTHGWTDGGGVWELCLCHSTIYHACVGYTIHHAFVGYNIHHVCGAYMLHRVSMGYIVFHACNCCYRRFKQYGGLAAAQHISSTAHAGAGVLAEG